MYYIGSHPQATGSLKGCVAQYWYQGYNTVPEAEAETRSDIRDGLTRLHRHIATYEPHLGNALEIEVAMLGNMCFDIMLASSGIFHLYKVLRDINIRVLYHRKHTQSSESITLLYHCNETYCSIEYGWILARTSRRGLRQGFVTLNQR